MLLESNYNIINFMKKTIIKLVVAGILLPSISFAATNKPTKVENLSDLVNLAIAYFGDAVIIILGLAVVMFVYNVFKYFIAGGDDVGAKKEAGLYVMYSIIGFFVILSMWGLVYILTNTFKLTNTQPTLPFGIFNTSSNTNFGNGGLSPANNNNNPRVTPATNTNYNENED
jgi:hypothetical protein